MSLLGGLKARRLQRLTRRRLKCPVCGKYNWNEAQRCEHCGGDIADSARHALHQGRPGKAYRFKLLAFWAGIFVLLWGLMSLMA